MSQNALSQFFKRWIRQARRQAQPESSRWVKLRTEELESRLAPAVLPAPTVYDPTHLGGGYSPQIAVNPANPTQMVTVSTNFFVRPDGSTFTSVGGTFSFDGGASWNSYTIASTGLPTLHSDPLLVGQNPTQYSHLSSADIAFGTANDFYVTYLETNAGFITNAANTSGAVAVAAFTFDSFNGPILQSGPQQIYQWVNQDPAFNPTIGIDTNSLRDPATGALLPVDSMLGTAPDRRTKTVYVAWNTQATTPNDVLLNGGFQPNTILVAASNDAGATYTSPVIVPANGYYGPRASAPQIVFTPNETNPNTLTGVAPGTLSFIWQQPVNPANGAGGRTLTQSTSLPDGGDPAQEAAGAGDFTAPGGGINIAINAPTAPPVIDAQIGVTQSPPSSASPNLVAEISPIAPTTFANPPVFGTINVNVTNQPGAAYVANGYGTVVYLYIPVGFNIAPGFPNGGPDWFIRPGIATPPYPPPAGFPAVPYTGFGPQWNSQPNGPNNAGPYQIFTAVYTGSSGIGQVPGTTPPQNVSLPTIAISGTMTAAASHFFKVTAIIDGAQNVRNNNALGNIGNNVDEVLYLVGAPPPDTPQTTTFSITPDFSGFPLIKPTDLVKDLTASVAITYPFIEDLSLILTAPNGESIVLLQNHQNENNTINQPPRGGTTTGLPGVVNFGAFANGNNVFAQTANGRGATFDDVAPRYVMDTANVAPYVAHFKPEGNHLNGRRVGTVSTLEDLVAGMTRSDAEGPWTLTITSWKGRGSPPPAASLQNWNLHFSFNIQNSPSDRANPGFTADTNPVSFDGVAVKSIAINGDQFALGGITTVLGAPNQTYPLPAAPVVVPPVSPVQGIGPTTSIAYDTSIGGPYSGRMYVAYTGPAFPSTTRIAGTNTFWQDHEVYLAYSDDGGASFTGPIIVNTDTPTDNLTEGRRMQFMPTVTVDPVTGTVVIMWYDTRYDPSNARATTFIATSIDGGNTFSPEAFVNSPKEARNALDPSQYVMLEPIPSVLVGSGPFQFGIRQGLLAHDGRIVTVWTGNSFFTDENGTRRSNAGGGTAIYSNVVTTASGPRLVTGDSGIVTAQATITDAWGNPTTVTVNGTVVATYNDTFAADGTRQLNGFRVRFDRPVLASTFTAANVRVNYQDPLSGQYISVAVQNPVPIDPVWAQFGGQPGIYLDSAGIAYYYPAGTTDAFWVPFTTPQAAVGTYSYSVGPAFNAATGTTSGITDTLHASIPVWDSIDAPIVIPPGQLRNQSVTTSNAVVNAPAGTTLSNVAVTVSVEMPQDLLNNGMQTFDLTMTLIAPDGTRVVLAQNSPPSTPFPPNPSTGFLLTTFDNLGTQNRLIDGLPPVLGVPPFYTTTDPPFRNFPRLPNPNPLTPPPYTGRFQPDSYDPFAADPTITGLGVLNGKPANGTWRLEISNANGFQGILTGWSLSLTDSAGALIQKRGVGNVMDQNANGVSGEFVNAANGARVDNYSNPAPTNPFGVTVPFQNPYASNTLPLIIPGPQVANTSVVVTTVPNRPAPTTSQAVKVVSISPQVGTNDIFVVLNREVDPTSFTTSMLTGVFGPTGSLAVSSVEPAYSTFAPSLVAGTTAVNVTFADPSALLNTTKILSLTGPQGNIDPRTLTILATADPATYRIVFPGTTQTFDPLTGLTYLFDPLTTGGQYIFKFTPDLIVANPGVTQNTATGVFRVRMAAPIQSAINPLLASGVSSYNVKFASPPGSFTPANITSIVGPGGAPIPGPYTVTPVSPTEFQINFPAVTATGNYLFTFNFSYEAAVNSLLAPGNITTTITLPAAPPRVLTAADLVSVVGPDGAFGGPFIVTQLTPTTYRIDFPGPILIGGYYKFTFDDNPAVDESYTVNLAQTLRPADGLALNGVVSAIDVTFDRLIEPTSFRVANILRITGPAGNVPLTAVTITPVSSSFDSASGGYRTFQIGFPTQLVDGVYTIQLGPDPSETNKALASIRSAVELPILVQNLSSGTTTVPVQFSANSIPGPVTPATLSPSIIQSITAPNGALVPVPAGTTITRTGSTASTTYNIVFPAGTITQTGQFVIRFAAAAGANPGVTVFGTGPQVDTNRNAGLDKLRGIDPTATVTTKTYATPLVPGIQIPSGGTVNLPISIADNFIIQPGQNPNQQIMVLLNIAFPYDPDLDIEIVAPDGTTSILFNGSGVQGLLNQANFSNTLFTDSKITATGIPVQPISAASPPYNPFAGAFNPQLQLSPTLTGKSSQGIWNLRVTNNGTRTGTLQNWALTLPAAVPGTGLGEAVADQLQVGFRVFTQDPSNITSESIWTPMGPSSQNSGQNAGRVSAIQIDSSDPSGNTVYAAGAAGGVWKTTNFMTTDPAGPNWIPLTDFGPTGGGNGFGAAFGTANSLNIGSIALFSRNNDPNQTVILVGTGETDGQTFGSGNAPGTGNPLTDLPGLGTPGIGFLLSTDGGRTWSVLDSTNNVDALGNVLPVLSTARDHLFLQSTVSKVVIDPAAAANGQLIFYAAVSPSNQGGNPAAQGVWRSLDTGKTWRLMQAGQATDLFLAPGSASAGTTNKNIQKLYAGFAGANAGVFFTDSATSAVSMIRLTGGQQNSLFVDEDLPYQFDPIPIANTVGVFPGATGNGKVLIVGPSLSSSPLLNEFYQGWLYALVSNANGTFNNLYMTKDFGRNWVPIDMSQSTVVGSPTNDNSEPNVAPNGTFLLNHGMMNLALAIDPANPYIVYVGGSNYGFAPSGAVYTGAGLLRVDTTKLEDSQAIVAYSNSQPGLSTATPQQLAQFAQLPAPDGPNNYGNINIPAPPPVNPFRGGPGGAYGLVATQAGNPLAPTVNTGWLNVFRDPFDPFRANATLHFTNVESVPGRVGIQNRGFGAVVTPFTAGELGDNVRSLVTFLDPITRQTRLLVGDNQGISSILDTGVTSGLGAGAGTDAANMFTSVTGFGPNGTQYRNGNLAIAQFYSGSAQPSQLAADIAGAMFYGMSMDNGFPASSADILQTGNVNWLAAFGYQTATGYGSDVHTDQTGSGTAYQFRFPVTPASYQVPGNDQNTNVAIPTDFFRVIPEMINNPAGFSRTNGLLQAGDQPQNFLGQWDAFFGSKFSVNPVDPNGLLVSANDQSSAAAPGGAGTGRLFRSTNQGVDWFPIGLPGTAAAFGTAGPTLDNTYAAASAFGAPTAADLQAGLGDLNHFVYVGTTGGRILASDTGGAPWFNITGPIGSAFGNTDSLDGSPVMQIIPNPKPDSTDVFVVTQQGVYYNANVFVTGSNPRRFDPNSTWVNLTGNLFLLQNGVFNSATDLQYTLNFLTSIAVDWRYRIPTDPSNPNSPTFPVLYAAGNAGVYRSIDALSATGPTWSYFPTGATITDSTGTNATIPTGGYLPNVMVTSLSLSLGNIEKSTGLPDQSGGPNLLFASTWGRGSFGIRLGDVLPQYNGTLQDGLQSGPAVVSAVSLAPLGGPANTIRVTFDGPVDPSTFHTGTVNLVSPSGATVPIVAVNAVRNPDGQGADLRNVYDIVINPQSATGSYTLTIGYNPSGGNRPTITDLGGNKMNQNGNQINGDAGPAPAGDQYTTAITLVTIPQPSGVVITPNAPGPYRVGVPVNFTVRVLDSLGNVTTTANGSISVTLNPNDPAATITTVPVVNGVGSITITFGTVGTYTVSGVVGGNVNTTGSVSGIVVTTAGGGGTLNGTIAVGSGDGGSPTVNVYDNTGALQGSFLPFPPGAYGQVDPFSVGFTGGIRTASGDVTGDGIADLIIGNGPTISSHVLVIDGATGQTVLDFMPFEASFLGGIYVAVGDVTGDGISEIVVTPDLSGGPRVTVLRGGDFRVIANFFGIDDKNFRGGARAAVGDITGDGFGEVVVSAGFGGGPRISVYDGRALTQQNRLSHPVPDFFMFEPTLRNGAFVAVGDVDGDGFDDIIGGGGPGGGPRVLALSGFDLARFPPDRARVLANFFAGNIDNRGGIRVAAKDLDGDPLADIVVGDGEGAGSLVTGYSGANISVNPNALFSFDAFPGDFTGVYVG